MIPAAAVEAAAKAMFLMDRKEGWIAALPHETKRYYDLAVTALEAAAPHMLKELRELVENMEGQSWTEVGTIPGIAALIRSSARGML